MVLKYLAIFEKEVHGSKVLIHSGGKMALLALIVCVSLGLLAFYVTSTSRARRRQATTVPNEREVIELTRYDKR